MAISKNNKKSRSHKKWKKHQNLWKNSPKTKNADWMKKTKRVSKGFSNYGMLGQRFADYE